MKRASTVAAVTFALLIGLGSSASAGGVVSSESSYGIETALGFEIDETWFTVWGLAYEVTENGVVSDVLAPTVFVNGPTLSLECSAYTDAGDVDVDPNLNDGAFAGTIEGGCFDWIAEESIPFTISLDVTAVGTGRATSRGGSYYNGEARCVSTRSSRDGLTIGTVGIQIPDRGIDLVEDAVDEYASLVGFTSRCYPANGPKSGGHH